ncbi:MAG: aminomethyltransferase family protein [Gemmatimonadetes bacterium]|nr:aminomethyltransferase family protein [Gemmatimonadota bacterium]
MTGLVATPTPADYAQLREDAGLVDRTARRRFVFDGAQAGATLTGLLTNDVLALQPGHGQYAAALTPKGKVLADLRVFRRVGGDYLVDVAAPAAPGLAAMLRKYVNPRIARYADVSDALACLGVAGPHARQVVAHALACSPATFDLLPPYASAEVPFGDGAVMVARADDYGVDGFDCFVDAARSDIVRDALVRSGAAPASEPALEVVRIEAGRPAWGADMNDETLTQEALLDTLEAISHTKGCYTGQEVVARLHFRGHVNKLLRGLRLDAMPGDGARVVTGDADVGDVRSRAVSPRLGAIALGMIRREVEPGASVEVRWEGGATRAVVTALPFPA